MENLPQNESVPQKNLDEYGLFSNFDRQQILEIRTAIYENTKLTNYYKLVKDRLISESGLNSVHRGKILHEMHGILASGGDFEQESAKELERIVAAIK